MPDDHHLFQKLNIEPKLVISFFLHFSRFEYALKRHKKYANGNKNEVVANWELFASDYNEKILSELSEALSESIEYLLGNPPDKQVYKNGTLDWTPLVFGSEQQLGKLIQCIKTVRNNLFHGSKFPNKPQPDPSRNPKLIKHSLAVLIALLDLSDEVREIFEHEFVKNRQIKEAVI